MKLLFLSFYTNESWKQKKKCTSEHKEIVILCQCHKNQLKIQIIETNESLVVLVSIFSLFFFCVNLIIEN